MLRILNQQYIDGKMNNFYKENKEIYNKHKTKCCICGEDTKCCLEFHHIGEKHFNISKSLKYITPK